MSKIKAGWKGKESQPANDSNVNDAAKEVAKNLGGPQIRRTMTPVLEHICLAGAAMERNVFQRIKHYSGLSIFATSPSTLKTKLPDNVKDAIGVFTRRSMSQPWWDKVGLEIAAKAAEKIGPATANGATLGELMEILERELPDVGKKRARLIARTETTGSLNAGVYAHQLSLKAMGIKIKKRWRDQDDVNVRQDHRQATKDNRSVEIDGFYTVGGEQCLFPGDVTLSAKQRCNCRCLSETIYPITDKRGKT